MSQQPTVQNKEPGYPPTLRFGIITLDRLIGKGDVNGENDAADSLGMPIWTKIDEKDEKRYERAVVSVCIAGTSGVGKSAIALHIASRYAADTFESKDVCVVYASTDLSYSQAMRTWNSFGLNNPKAIYDPFNANAYDDYIQGPEKWNPKLKIPNTAEFPNEVRLVPSSPSIIADYIIQPHNPGEPKTRHVAFLNLQTETAGDDWHFLNQLIAEMPGREETGPDSAHLLVIDAIEGLEMLGGDMDSFGMNRTRRSRIAQIIRTAGKKCHIVFVVEGGEAKDHPEKFIADLVIRLRNVQAPGVSARSSESGQGLSYSRRMVEVEKSRGQAHVRGSHVLIIRDSTNNLKDVHADADFPLNTKYKSYIHVIPSIHFVSSAIAGSGSFKPDEKSDTQRYVANFGIRYLDDMLRIGQSTNVKGELRGIPCGSVTALTGDTGTQKSPLAISFLARNFAIYARELEDKLQPLKVELDEIEKILKRHNDAFEQYKRTSGHRMINSKRRILSKDQRRFAIKQAKIEPNYKTINRKLQILNRKRSKSISAIKENSKEVQKVAGEKLKLIRKQYRIINKPLEEIKDFVNGSPRVSVMLTTTDIDLTRLANSFANHVTRNGVRFGSSLSENERTTIVSNLAAGLQKHTILRRLEKHDLSSSTLFHIIRQNVRKAQSLLKWNNGAKDVNKRHAEGHNIRVVIEDWQSILEAYEDVRNDNIFLPFLIMYLKREGLTTVIVQTKAGLPDLAHENVETDLQRLASHNLRTWRIRYKDRDCVAISAIPPIATDRPSIVGELRSVSSELDSGLTVDPNLDMYEGLHEGKPVLTPLRLRFYGETQRHIEYAKRVERLLIEQFPAANRSDIKVYCDQYSEETTDSTTSYENLRDLAHLQGPNRLDHTLVLMVDEFWNVGSDFTRKWPDRALKDLKDYVNTTTWNKKYNDEIRIDPNNIFQRDWLGAEQNEEIGKRYTFFEDMPKSKHGKNQKFDSKKFEVSFDDDSETLTLKNSVDRLPFVQNFAFLQCRESAFNLASQSTLKIGEDTVLVSHVWSALQRITIPEDLITDAKDKEIDLSWRAVLHACKAVADSIHDPHVEIRPFALARHSPESLSCLALEIWASELYAIGLLQANVEDLSDPLKRWGEEKRQCGLIEWLDDRHRSSYEVIEIPPPYALVNNVHISNHQLALYKTLIMLAEVFVHSDLDDSDNPFQSPSGKQVHAVASREWFTTACQDSEHYDLNNPTIPCRLPGHFTTRGDWFLAVAEGSRSTRLAENTLDLLSSETSNIARLQNGIGLPTRVNSENRFDHIKTPVLTTKASQIKKLNYRELLNLGASNKDNFHWLWRSRLTNYDRHARIWQKWLHAELSHYIDIRRSQASLWKSGFDIYDKISAKQAQKQLYHEVNSLDTFNHFISSCEELLNALKAASPIQNDR